MTPWGVFVPNSKYRARVTPAKRGRGAERAIDETQQPTTTERRAAMTEAQRLTRVFGIDIETCPGCGGALRIIACIEERDVIDKILAHLDARSAQPSTPDVIAPTEPGAATTGGGVAKGQAVSCYCLSYIHICSYIYIELFIHTYMPV